jgi:hypothetical protein
MKHPLFLDIPDKSTPEMRVSNEKGKHIGSLISDGTFSPYINEFRPEELATISEFANNFYFYWKLISNVTP